MDSSEDEELFITQRSTNADISAEIPGFRKTMVSSQDKGLCITQSSTNADISAEIEGNVVSRLDISLSALILYRLLKAAFPFSFFK